MEKSVQITAIIVGAVILLAVIGIFVFYDLRGGTTISTTGQAEINAVPDLISVYFNVQTINLTAKDAKDANAEIVDNILTALIKEGFERKDITTENYNIYPDYTWEDNKQKFNGYRATQTLKVQLSAANKDKAGEVIDAGVDAGALLSYINFELTQESQNTYKAEALKLATEDAKLKAESIAAGVDKEVSSLVSISDSTFDYRPWPIYMAAGETADISEAKTATTNIQPGEQTISARVSAVFKIK